MSKDKIEDAIYTRRYIYNFHYHLIWVTKYRNPTFTSEALVNEMKEILTTVAADNKIVIEHMEVMPDHVHVLISFPPSKAPTSAIKALKGRSAFIFLKRHPEINSVMVYPLFKLAYQVPCRQSIRETTKHSRRPTPETV